MKRLLFLGVLAVVSFKGVAQDKVLLNTFDPAFVHNVYFWLHNPDSEEDRAAFETALKELLRNSMYTRTNFIGTPPKAIRDVVDDTFTYNLVVTFHSAEAQENYQVEEAHLKFIEDAKHLWKKVVVYDAIGYVE